MVASLVIAAAGVGSIIEALSAGVPAPLTESGAGQYSAIDRLPVLQSCS